MHTHDEDAAQLHYELTRLYRPGSGIPVTKKNILLFQKWRAARGAGAATDAEILSFFTAPMNKSGPLTGKYYDRIARRIASIGHRAYAAKSLGSQGAVAQAEEKPKKGRRPATLKPVRAAVKPLKVVPKRGGTKPKK